MPYTVDIFDDEHIGRGMPRPGKRRRGTTDRLLLSARQRLGKCGEYLGPRPPLTLRASNPRVTKQGIFYP